MANLKDLIVNGSARILGTIYGNLTGNVTGNVSGSSGSCTGNAATATKATQDASGNVITSTYATKTELGNKMDKVTLAKVATSNSFNDLDNKPTIPSQVTESTVSGWGFTKNTGTYSKPSDGIPKTDLASSVQTSLGKADSALQSINSSQVTTALGFTPYNSTNPSGYTSNKGTVTKVNNTSPDANGNVTISIPSQVTESTVSGWGFTKNAGTYSKPSGGIPKTDLASAVQTSLGKADTALQSFTETDPTVPAHVKSITEANISTWNGKQATLVSGTNIKTINGDSILGSGNLTIEAGAGIDYLTQEEYEARKEAGTLDENKYYSTPNDVSLQILEILYPVGSLYLTTASTCPLATLGLGTWQIEASDRVLQGAGTRGAVGTTVDESLPNIKGNTNYSIQVASDLTGSGAIQTSLGTSTTSGASGNRPWARIDFNASRSSSTYKDNAPVQQNAYLINVFRRIA